MKISIITATWNSEASIRDTIDSLALQDYPREQIEWVVVDGASTDRTVSVVNESGFRPDKMLSEPDRGIYDALNKRVSMATGDVVGFLHADDFLAAPDVLSRVAAAFSDSGAEAVYGDLQYVQKIGDNGGFPEEHKDAQRTTCGDSAQSATNNRQSAFRVIRHWKSGNYARENLKWGWMPPHPSLYLKREVYERAALSPGTYFDTTFSCAADYDFMMRILSKYGVAPAYLEKVLVKMQIGGTSNRSLKHIIQKSREDWQVIRRNRIGSVHTLVGKNFGKLGQFFVR